MCMAAKWIPRGKSGLVCRGMHAVPHGHSMAKQASGGGWSGSPWGAVLESVFSKQQQQLRSLDLGITFAELQVLRFPDLFQSFKF